jgi:hypothetical protein
MAEYAGTWSYVSPTVGQAALQLPGARIMGMGTEVTHEVEPTAAHERVERPCTELANARSSAATRRGMDMRLISRDAGREWVGLRR